MFSVLLKSNKNEQSIYTGSLSNCLLVAEDKAIEIVAFYEGNRLPELFFQKEHPSSTLIKPLCYSIPSYNKFNIYQHRKVSGMLFSEHFYDKICSIKIVRSGEVKSVYETTNFEYHDVWNRITSVINNNSF